jgi:hypothetical protein
MISLQAEITSVEYREPMTVVRSYPIDPNTLRTMAGKKNAQRSIRTGIEKFTDQIIEAIFYPSEEEIAAIVAKPACHIGYDPGTPEGDEARVTVFENGRATVYVPEQYRDKEKIQKVVKDLVEVANEIESDVDVATGQVIRLMREAADLLKSV